MLYNNFPVYIRSVCNLLPAPVLLPQLRHLSWRLLCLWQNEDVKKGHNDDGQAKGMKTAYLRWHDGTRKHCATAAVKRRLTQTFRLCLADLISSRRISLRTNQERGPHNQLYTAKCTYCNC